MRKNNILIKSLLGFSLSLPLFAGCQNAKEVLKNTHMDLGVKFDTYNPIFVKSVTDALNFWQTKLNFSWHIDNNSMTCSIDIIETNVNKFLGIPKTGKDQHVFAVTQDPKSKYFTGITYFDSYCADKMSPEHWYEISVHELGHQFGLGDSPDSDSVMLGVGFGKNNLTNQDLAMLSKVHELR